MLIIKIIIIIIIIIIILPGRTMNSAKSTPPQRGVFMCWSPETSKRPEFNRLFLYYYYHHHHHHYGPHIIIHDRQCVGSKLLRIFVVDSEYVDGKTSNKINFQASRLNMSVPPNITQGNKETVCVASWGGQKVFLV